MPVLSPRPGGTSPEPNRKSGEPDEVTPVAFIGGKGGRNPERTPPGFKDQRPVDRTPVEEDAPDPKDLSAPEPVPSLVRKSLNTPKPPPVPTVIPTVVKGNTKPKEGGTSQPTS